MCPDRQLRYTVRHDKEGHLAQPVPVHWDDGSELTRRAWDLLQHQAPDLGIPDLHIQPLADFLREAEQHRTSTADRDTIVHQATLIFDHLYPHMPFKTELYAFQHPSDYLRAEVQPNLDTLPELDFQARMITAFSLVRDAHTLYGLPSPFRGAVAFLPIQIQAYLDQKTGWRFIVTRAMHTSPDAGFEHDTFGPGAEIVGWGNLTTLAHIERTEAHLPGGNYFASFLRGVIHSTLRPLVFVQLPFSDELPNAILHYIPRGQTLRRVIELPWGVATGFDHAASFPASVFSVSPSLAIARSYGRLIHKRKPISTPPRTDPDHASTMPDVFEFRTTADDPDLVDPHQPGARFGYLRIRAFSDASTALGATDRMVDEFRRILTLLDQTAPDGLVLDLRNNPGGDVRAAERMLQMLTPQPVEPTRFHLANTPVVLEILRNLAALRTESLTPEEDLQLASAMAELEAWMDDAGQDPLPSGSRLTTGKPLTPPDAANDTGQIYHGRGVALLVNSLTYSAADIFAAGFQDHSIGPILGTALGTGGGGADVWSHQDLIEKIGPRPAIPLMSLPGNASMSLAIRRCSRVLRSEGEPVEDKGVMVDIYYITDNPDDLMAGNPGIIRRALEEFRDLPVFRLDAEIASAEPLSVSVQSTGLHSFRFYVDGDLALIADASTAMFTVPTKVTLPRLLRIEGYDTGGRLVRARTLPMPVTEQAQAAFDPAMQSITGLDPSISNA